MSDLVSSVPGVYTAALGLITAAAGAQSPAVPVFAFELGQYEPGSYVTVHAIQNHIFNPEDTSYAQIERYDISGIVTVFSGASVVDDPTVVTDVLSQTYSVFQNCVMGPLVSNRTIPILGTTGPSPYQMLPGYIRYEGNVGDVGGGPAGWVGILTWSFHFEAYISVT